MFLIATARNWSNRCYLSAVVGIASVSHARLWAQYVRSRLTHIDSVKGNPCSPSPCGPNSLCRENNRQPVCSCVAGFLGVPPTCRPECTVSSECPLTEACSNQKCINPCLGACGIRAMCQVINHNPICSCPGDLDGDPFIRCVPRRKNHRSSRAIVHRENRSVSTVPILTPKIVVFDFFRAFWKSVLKPSFYQKTLTL